MINVIGYTCDESKYQPWKKVESLNLATNLSYRSFFFTQKIF